mgnify:CR=1 FL=1
MTLKDIAKLANVSVATVSRTINNSDSVSPETKARIRKIIRENGYFPNYIGKQLRQAKSNKILALLPTITNSFYSEILRGIEDYASKSGYTVLMCDTRFDAQIEQQCLNLLLTQQVDGVISFLSTLPDQVLQDIASNYPYVQCCEVSPNVACPKVTIDNYQAAYDAVSYFLRKGYRRIGLITGSLYPYACAARNRGYYAAIQAGGVPVIDELIISSDFSYSGGFDACRQLFSLSNKPEAIFAFSDTLAIGATRALNELGIHAGIDVEVIGFDDDSVSAFNTPPISTISQPRYEFGTSATELLLEKIQDFTCVNKNIVFPHRLIHRNSTVPQQE